MKNIIASLVPIILIITTVTAQNVEKKGKSLLWKQCNEDVIKIYVDPEPFQELIPSGHKLALFDDKAWVLLLPQDCPQYRLDGEEIGATDDVHMWIALEGPQEVQSVIGAERTLPTMTWFALFTGSNNARCREIWTASGTSSLPIHNVHLDPPGPERGGHVILNKEQSFSWHVKSKAPWVRLLGVNHNVYDQDETGKVILNRIQILVTMSAYDSPGTLEVVGGIGPENLISAGKYDVEVHAFTPLWARAFLGEE